MISQRAAVFRNGFHGVQVLAEVTVCVRAVKWLNGCERASDGAGTAAVGAAATTWPAGRKGTRGRVAVLGMQVEAQQSPPSERPQSSE